MDARLHIQVLIKQILHNACVFVVCIIVVDILTLYCASVLKFPLYIP